MGFPTSIKQSRQSPTDASTGQPVVDNSSTVAPCSNYLVVASGHLILTITLAKKRANKREAMLSGGHGGVAHDSGGFCEFEATLYRMSFRPAKVTQ